MAEIAAVNASPLIVLARAGHFDLLKFVADRIVMPRAVYAEINRRGAGDPAVDTLAMSSWLEVVDAPPVPQAIADRNLGEGESALIAWGLLHAGSILILDDLAARRCASSLGLAVKGTLSVLLSAKQAGRVPAVAPIVADIRAAGLYLSDHLVQSFLLSAGEVTRSE